MKKNIELTKKNITRIAEMHFSVFNLVAISAITIYGIIGCVPFLDGVSEMVQHEVTLLACRLGKEMK